MNLSGYAAILFDLDGVLTPTAVLHRRAWSEMFDAFLARRGDDRAFSDADYFTHVDGRSRYEGVETFLRSRGIELARGTPSDAPDTETVSGLGNRKNDLVTALIAEGVRPYPGSVAFLDSLPPSLRPAVVSSSRNARSVLASSGLAERFPVVVDGEVAAAEGLPGKPLPDTFLRGAELLGAAPAETVVVEDAVSGVEAGAAGGFGLVIGVDRGTGHAGLRAAGADVVVDDLEELIP